MSDTLFGVMLDCSRNGVLTVPAVKRYIDKLRKMGYTMLMLYTEDTYEVENQPYFGYARGRYSIDEMKELVDYAEANGIEMIPCIQTLAHLNQMFRWRRAAYEDVWDIDDILMIDEEKTYALIEDMFRTLRACYKTKYIHIGMDEAHNVGKGKFLDKNGLGNRFEILSRHLGRVAKLAEKYGFKPIMWSDMFFRLATGTYRVKDPDVITPEIAALVPENVELVYWDYYSDDKQVYDAMNDAHARFGKPQWFAGGAWTWADIVPHNAISMRRMKLAMQSCRERGIKNVFITCWGDNGAETNPFTVLPALHYISQIYHGVEDMEEIKKSFLEIVGVDMDDYLKLDLPAIIREEGLQNVENPDKCMLYNDPFLGIYDVSDPGDGAAEKSFAESRDKLTALGDVPEYGYLFKSEAALCDLMTLKFGLGTRTRKAYLAGDRDALKKVIGEYYETEKKLAVYYEAYREVWEHDRKGNGFEVQDYRMGGLRQRLLHCARRLEQYLAGETEKIGELEEKLLPQPEGLFVYNWNMVATTGIVG